MSYVNRADVHHVTIDGQPRCKAAPSVPIFYPCTCATRRIAEYCADNIRSLYLPNCKVEVVAGECPVDIDFQAKHGRL